MKLTRYLPSYQMPKEMPLSTEKASQVGAAIESFGRTGMAVGAKMHEVFIEKQKAQDTLDGIKMLNEARITLHQKALDLQKEPNENVIEQKYRESFNEIRDRAMEAATGRKHLTEFLTKSFSDLDAFHTNQVKDMVFSKWHAKAIGEYTAQVYNYSQMAIGSASESDQKRFMAEGEAFIRALDGSILTSDDVAKEIIKFRATTSAGIATADIQRDPKTALAKLEARGYEHLDETKRLELIEAAKAQLKQVEREERDAHLNDVYLQLKDKYGIAGFERIQIDLMDPQFMRKNDITSAEAHQLGIRVRAEKGDWDAMVAEKQDKTERNMYRDVYNKKTTVSKVLSEMEQGNIRPSVGNHFITILTSEKAAASDKAFYSEVLQDILFERKPTREIYSKIIEAIADGRLNDTAADKLFLKLDAQEEKGIKFRQGRAIKRIEDVLMPKRGIMSPFTATPDEVELVHAVQNEFLDWIEKRKEAGNPPTAKEVDDKVSELISSNKMTMYERLENVSQKLKEEAEDFRKKKLGKKGQATQRKPGETIEQYLKRTGQK